MTKSMQAALEEIGCQLDAGYLPTLTQPLPRELEHLLAQLVAYETRKRVSTKHFGDGLQSLIPPSVVPRTVQSAAGAAAKHEEWRHHGPR